MKQRKNNIVTNAEFKGKGKLRIKSKTRQTIIKDCREHTAPKTYFTV